MQTQLQVISTYTLLNSTTTIDQLINAAKNRGYSSIALTDRNILYGAVEFYEKAKQADLKPLLGLELEIESIADPEKAVPMVLLAKNESGFKQLMALSTKRMMEDAPVSLAFLERNSHHLIAITPGMNGEVSQALLASNRQAAAEALEKYKKIFAHFYAGYALRAGGPSVQQKLLSLANELNVSVTAFDPVEYIDEDDAFAVDVLKTISANETIESVKILEKNRHLLAAAELTSLYEQAGLKEIAETADKIAEQISIDLILDQPVLPRFPIPEGRETDEYLKQLCTEALPKRIQNPSQIYKDRLEKELTIISKMGFSDYFLIVWDLICFAHSQKIVTGSGRGSAVGSLVSYVLKITDVDPIAYGLLFERFLNEERYSMPDIDLDFPDNQREKMLFYVNQKYGQQHVAQIATFGTFAAKMAVRDSGRVFGLTTQELKKWSDAIPTSLGMTLKRAVEESEKLRKLIEENEQNQLIFDTAKRIEGLPRHVSTHAAGVVISDKPLIDSVPLQQGNGTLSLTQFAMADVEKVGLLKMDFLGLRNLTILSDCLRLTNTDQNLSMTLNDIPLNDPKTLEVFKRGATNGIFQFESPGIKRVLKKLEPNDIEDVIAVNALYRPGPMEQIDTFISRKKGNEPIVYPHDDLEDILGITYGIMVYQEQVMRVASKLAGYSLAEADMLRRAISKKIKSEIDKGRAQFIAGAVQKGYTEDTAATVYHYIEQFANYGFNRSHAVAYSMVAYQLAYFKAHYPAAFYAALMKASSNNKSKLQEYIVEARKRSVKMAGPDINTSDYSFTMRNGIIQSGLDIVKGLRRDLIHSIYSNRRENGQYKDFIDFISRLESKWRKEQYIKPLVYAGAFDQLPENRGTILHSLEGVIDSINMSSGNMELFESLAPRIESVEDLSQEEKLEQEFSVTGFYLSSHPSEQYDELRKAYQMQYIADAKSNRSTKILGTIKSIKTIQTKRGEPMSFVDVTDQTGTCSLTLFPEQHRKYIKRLEKNVTVAAEGKMESDQNGLKLLVRNLNLADSLSLPEKHKTLFLKIESLKEQQEQFTDVQAVLKQHGGNIPVLLYESSTEQKHLLKKQFSVDGSEELLKTLKRILGEKQVILR